MRKNCRKKHRFEERIEGRIEGTGRRRRRPKQLLDDLKEKTGYWKLMGEALDRRLWRTRFGQKYGHIVRQNKVRVSE